MPFGPYNDFADCVAKNKAKVRDVDAYCASIERNVIGPKAMAKKSAEGRHATAVKRHQA